MHAETTQHTPVSNKYMPLDKMTSLLQELSSKETRTTGPKWNLSPLWRQLLDVERQTLERRCLYMQAFIIIIIIIIIEHVDLRSYWTCTQLSTSLRLLISVYRTSLKGRVMLKEWNQNEQSTGNEEGNLTWTHQVSVKERNRKMN